MLNVSELLFNNCLFDEVVQDRLRKLLVLVLRLMPSVLLVALLVFLHALSLLPPK